MNHYTPEPRSGGPDGEATCPNCGSDQLSRTLITDRFLYGAGAKGVELSAQIPVETCLNCALEFSGEEAERARHEAVCRHLGVLNPQEITAIRQRYGISRARFAEITRVGTATLARWEGGEIIQNPAMDTYMRLVARPEIFAVLKSDLLYEAPEESPVRRGSFEELPTDIEPFEFIGRRDVSQQRALLEGKSRFNLISPEAEAA